jgi:hypothetical protein
MDDFLNYNNLGKSLVGKFLQNNFIETIKRNLPLLRGFPNVFGFSNVILTR